MDLGRNITGAKYHARRKSRLYERTGYPRQTVLGETKKKIMRTRGGHEKRVLLKVNIVNVATGKEIKKAEIINVLETPQNRFLARQNRIIKGAIIETSLGKARITNRPGQEGQVNAVLVKE